jgi:chromate transporter
MRSDPDTLATLFVQFAVLSFFAIGGGGSAVPEMHRQTVEIAQLLTDRQFSELFAIAQAAPGPNIMFVALLGHFIAGVPGAAVATVAMCGPSCVLAYAVSRFVERFRDAQWRIAIQSGLVPVTIGLIAASALIIAQGADRDWASFAVTATTFALVCWTRVSPLVAFVCAALLGLGGFV